MHEISFINFSRCVGGKKYSIVPLDTVLILNFRTDRSGQTVQTQILEEQSDQGLHCLLFHLHVVDKIPSGLASLFK